MVDTCVQVYIVRRAYIVRLAPPSDYYVFRLWTRRIGGNRAFQQEQSCVQARIVVRSSVSDRALSAEQSFSGGRWIDQRRSDA